MDKETRICLSKGIAIVEFPSRDLTEEETPIRKPPERFIAFRSFPFFGRVFNTNWVDPIAYPYSDLIKNWFGAAIDYYDLQSGAGVHTVGSKHWLDTPKKGHCFYGLINYEDASTYSDILKGVPGLINGVKIETESGIIISQMLTRHLNYYLSHPIQRIIIIEDSTKLDYICRSGEFRKEDRYHHINDVLENL